LSAVIHQMKANMEEQKKVLADQKDVLKQTIEITTTQERVLLMQLQSQITAMNAVMGLPDGMNADQFDQFMAMIPSIPGLSCNKTFDEIDVNGDKTIDIDEFQKLIDAIVNEAHPDAHHNK